MILFSRDVSVGSLPATLELGISQVPAVQAAP